MNITFKALWIGSLVGATLLVTQPVRADDWNKKTEFTFSEPVEVPGHVLPAGKYVFELPDSSSERNVVEIFSEDPNGKESLIATLLTIPDHMDQTPDEPVVKFNERPSGSPEPIHSWFYPGENTGWEFIYPKQ